MRPIYAIFFRGGVQTVTLRASIGQRRSVMTKDLFLHRSPPRDATQKPQPPSPEEMQAMFQKWNAWKAKFEQHIVDWGDKLKAGGKVVGADAVSDGPFIESKEVIGGFMI